MLKIDILRGEKETFKVQFSGLTPVLLRKLKQAVMGLGISKIVEVWGESERTFEQILPLDIDNPFRRY